MEDTKKSEMQNKSAKQFQQLQWHSQPPPPPPGLLPVAVDTIVTNFLQFALTTIIFLVILTSFGYDGPDVGWIIFAEIVILLISFPFYVKYICKNVLIWDKFFRRIDGWYSKHYKKSQENDTSCRRLILINVVWWLYAFVVFPLVICYSAYLSYKWYKNQRSDTNTDIGKIDWDSNGTLDVAEQDQYIKHAMNTFSVSYLGYLSKQASCLMCFIQDIPLLIISVIITNYLGLIAFSLSISWKLLCWFKHMYDIKGFRLFYAFQDFWDHYQLSDVKWIPLEDFGIEAPVPVYYTDAEKYKSRLKLGDMVKIFDESEDEWILGMVYKNCYHQKNDLVVLNWEKIDHNAYGNGQDYTIPNEAIMRVNRWDKSVQPLNEEELQRLEDNKDDKDDNDDNDIGDEKEKRTQLTQITETGENTKLTTMADDDKKSEKSSDKSSDQNIASTASDDINNNNEQYPLTGADSVIVNMNEKNNDKTVHEYQSVALDDNV